MRLTVKPENILEAIALKTRKGFQPFLIAFAISSVRRFIASGSSDKTIKIWLR